MAVPRTPPPACPIERAVSVVGGRWKTMIVYRLLPGPLRYGRLRRHLAGCAERVFVRQVRELEADGVVERVALGGNPPQVEYRLTALGRELHAMFAAMERWGTLHIRQAPAGGVAARAAS